MPGEAAGAAPVCGRPDWIEIGGVKRLSGLARSSTFRAIGPRGVRLRPRSNSSSNSPRLAKKQALPKHLAQQPRHRYVEVQLLPPESVPNDDDVHQLALRSS